MNEAKFIPGQEHSEVPSLRLEQNEWSSSSRHPCTKAFAASGSNHDATQVLPTVPGYNGRKNETGRSSDADSTAAQQRRDTVAAPSTYLVGKAVVIEYMYLIIYIICYILMYFNML